MNDEYLSVEEAAKEIGVSISRLKTLILGGKIYVEKRPTGKPYVLYIRRTIIEKMKDSPGLRNTSRE